MTTRSSDAPDGRFAISAFSRSGRVTAHEIYQVLTRDNLWYFARHSKAIVPGVTVFFYQAAAGFVGEATVLTIRSVTAEDHRHLTPLGIDFLAVAADLENVVSYEDPVSLRENADRFHFVSTKAHWSYAVRWTPRIIDVHDARLLRILAGSQAVPLSCSDAEL